ncbi:MAG: Rieske 2Fe-2S domain-containing protein [Chromatiales bacterium]
MCEGGKIALCRLQDLPDPGSRGITLDTRYGSLEIFLVRKCNEIYGYINHCPHTGVNLDWVQDQFLDPSGGFIQCATHGALFRIEDGVCLRGPCVGARLRPIELQLEQGKVILISR